MQTCTRLMGLVKKAITLYSLFSLQYFEYELFLGTYNRPRRNYKQWSYKNVKGNVGY